MTLMNIDDFCCCCCCFYCDSLKSDVSEFGLGVCLNVCYFVGSFIFEIFILLACCELAIFLFFFFNIYFNHTEKIVAFADCLVSVPFFFFLNNSLSSVSLFIKLNKCKIKSMSHGNFSFAFCFCILGAQFKIVVSDKHVMAVIHIVTCGFVLTSILRLHGGFRAKKEKAERNAHAG